MTRLDRSVRFQLTRSEDGTTGDGLTMSGYAAVFDEPTEINSWEGTFTEQIRQGAFKKSLRENTPVVQFEHGRHPLIGSLPIGSIESLAEDAEGLFIEARLTDNWLIQPVRDAIADGAVDGMSFRFEVVRDEWRDGTGKRLTDPNLISQMLYAPGDSGPLQRTLVEVRLFELGPVVFPAYSGTSVGVRSMEAARGVFADNDLIQRIRGSLVAGTDPDLPSEVADDLALALLRTEQEPTDPPAAPSRGSDAPPAGHPDDSPEPPAPPAEGHPSPPTSPARTKAERDAYAASVKRTGYVTANAVGRKY